MRIANWYLLFLIPIVIYLFMRKKKHSSLKFSNIKLLRSKRNKNKLYKIGKYLVLASVITMILALSRPQIPKSSLPFIENGIDIAMLLDVSGSMESVDFQPNRLEVAKNTIDDFIEKRIDDRIALIVFGGNAYTRIPLTLDNELVRESVNSVEIASVKEKGTAIGMAISVGMNRLKKVNLIQK